MFTHKGYIIGVDARTPTGYKVLLSFRETKNFWIDTHNVKYRKRNGYPIGAWPVYKLDLTTIVALEKANND